MLGIVCNCSSFRLRYFSLLFPSFHHSQINKKKKKPHSLSLSLSRVSSRTLPNPRVHPFPFVIHRFSIHLVSSSIPSRFVKSQLLSASAFLDFELSFWFCFRRTSIWSRNRWCEWNWSQMWFSFFICSSASKNYYCFGI